MAGARGADHQACARIGWQSVIALRDRLQAMGYLGRTATAEYNAEMQTSVQQFQIDMGG